MGNSGSTRLPWLVVRHIKHEHIGTLAAAFKNNRLEYRYLDVFRGEVVPQRLEGFGGMLIMGGPMGVYEADRYPFLAAEMNLIRAAAGSGLPVLGICLGSQLIAAALGARVYPGGRKEIGWFPVEAVAAGDDLLRGLPASFMAFHWHGDTFDLPPGAVRLFRSQLYENQGFRCGRNIYALQFHFEVSAAMIEEWLADKGCQAEIASVSGLSAALIRQQTKEHAVQLVRLSEQLFTHFLAMVSAPAPTDH